MGCAAGEFGGPAVQLRERLRATGMSCGFGAKAGQTGHLRQRFAERPPESIYGGRAWRFVEVELQQKLGVFRIGKELNLADCYRNFAGTPQLPQGCYRPVDQRRADG